MTINDEWLKKRTDDLKASLHFLTRLRFGSDGTTDSAAIARAGWTFPIAGVLVGLAGGMAYALAHWHAGAAWPAAAISVAATMLLTGCLHEDGLADTADGLGGGNTREQKLAIMHDSRIGAYGVCALALAIAFRVGAVASLADSSSVILALIAAHAAARAGLPIFMFFVHPARSDGLAFAAGEPPRESVIAAAVLGAVILLLCLGLTHGIEALILLAIVMAATAVLSLRQIGGQTGDILGALEQVSEIAILFVAVR
jgi:adenosylcobinamide-GDP ribazoletransferase